jgi:hypothetical protein
LTKRLDTRNIFIIGKNSYFNRSLMMTQDATEILGLPLIAAGQAQKHVTVNEALTMLDAMVQLTVSSAEITQPPANPQNGARYLVPSDGTAAWLGHAGKIALWQDAHWLFLTPQQGWITWVADESRHRVNTSSGWRPLTEAMGTLPKLSVGAATASEQTPLAVGGAQTLLTHSGTSHRVSVNKKADADTASITFQTDYTGMAEIGATGSNDLSLKTSPSAGQWLDRMVIKRQSGNVGIGTSSPTMTTAGRVLHLHAADSTADWSMLHCTSGGSGGAAEGVIIGNAGGSAIFWSYDGVSILFGVGGATRMVILADGNCGIGISAPTSRLHVDGPIRTGSATVASLPSASATGAGALVYVSNAAAGAVHAFSDGTNWRRVDNRAIIS